MARCSMTRNGTDGANPSLGSGELKIPFVCGTAERGAAEMRRTVDWTCCGHSQCRSLHQRYKPSWTPPSLHQCIVLVQQTQDRYVASASSASHLSRHNLLRQLNCITPKPPFSVRTM